MGGWGWGWGESGIGGTVGWRSVTISPGLTCLSAFVGFSALVMNLLASVDFERSGVLLCLD